MKKEILQMLRCTDGYLSGQQLCDTLKVSRTAVWKVIGQLKEEGYEIEAVRNKGYRIASGPDIVSAEEVESRLRTNVCGHPCYFFAETDSTNTRAKQLAEEGAKEGTLVLAEKQNAGKGRRGRSWESPAGSSIYMSLLLRPDFAPQTAPMLTLVMGYSVAKAVKELTGAEVGIKWPNDIVIDGKKICGILTEMSAEVDFIHYAVIGVGVNANTEHFPEELAHAASIKSVTGRAVHRAGLIAEIMANFEEAYAKFCEAEDLGPILDEYNELLVNRGNAVCVLDPAGEYRAKALGIDRKGELLVEMPDGEIRNVYSGEVSVRGIYGYV